jgi:hypothetical protein
LDQIEGARQDPVKNHASQKQVASVRTDVEFDFILELLDGDESLLDPEHDKLHPINHIHDNQSQGKHKRKIVKEEGKT